MLRQQPIQRRSRQSMNRILEATRKLVEKRPFDELTVDEIVAEAGSSKGSFYHRFSDKESLLRVLNGEEFEQALARWSAFLDPASWENPTLLDVAAGIVARLVEIYRRRRPLMRAFSFQARFGNDEEIRRQAARLNRHVELLLQDLLVRWRIVKGDPESARRVAFALQAVGAAAREQILFRDEAAAAHDDQLGRDLTEMFVAYVGGSRVSSPDSND